MLEWVRVSALRRHCDPFKTPVWDFKHPIRREEVQEAIQAGRLTAPHKRFDRDVVRRKTHIQRVAWLVVHRCGAPIEIDVGVPSLQCYVDWIVTDGNHRLAAAIYRKDPFILAGISGSVEYKREILGRTTWVEDPRDALTVA